MLTRRGLLSLSGLLLPVALRAELEHIAIGANPAGTNFHLIAGAFAKVLQEVLGIRSIVRPYAGSSVYIPLLQRGEIALGINSSIDSFLSFAGQSPYSAPMSNLRALMAVYPLGYMYWVRANSGLRRVEELRAKRVVLNYRGLVVLDRLNRAILATGGLPQSDVTPVTAAGLPEGARAVLEGRADAAPMGYRLPLVRQTAVALPGGLRFLTMGADEGRVPELMPGAWVTTIRPGRSTVGIEGPIRSAMYDTYLNTGTHVADEDAYRIVGALRGHWSELEHDYPLLADEHSSGPVPSNNPHPYHGGAIRYFREAGLWTPAHERNQRRLLER